MTGIVEKIRAAAALRREATPGPWYIGDAPDAVRAGQHPNRILVAGTSTRPENAAYIAAAGSLTAEELEALADAQQQLEVARFVATYWRDSIMGVDGPLRACAHPLAMVLAALGGETEPSELGIEDGRHDDFRAALDRLQETTP